MDLSKLFNPESIAIVGVSREPKKVGHLVAKNLLAQGYKGKIYFINNKYKGKILGKTVYSSLTDAFCDTSQVSQATVVVLAVPADIALIYLDEMNKLGIKNAVIFAAGFKEIGELGVKREELLLDKARKYGINILGPNCLGFVNTKMGANLTFLKHICPKGNIGFVSQSGALGSMMVDHYAVHRNLGFSYFVSIGNKSIIDESDVLEFLGNDINTKVIAMYLEDVKNGEKFKKTLLNITKIKPIVVLKSGTTSEGSKAASSHTGGMVGDDEVMDAVFKQYGVIRATNMTEFLTILKILSFDKAPKSENILGLSNAGGIGVLLADELIKNNLKLITISEKTKKDIVKRMGQSHKITLHNPIDVLGDASAFDYQQVIEATMKEKDIGCIMVMLTPQANTEIHKTAEVIEAAQKKFDKPIYPLYFGEKSIEGSHLFFEENKIASFYKYDYLPQSLTKILKWQEYINQKTQPQAQPHLLKLSLIANKSEIETIIKNTSKSSLNLIDSLDILGFLDIPEASYIFLEKTSDVKKMFSNISFPCVAKIVSDSISHKTEVGGVITNIDSEEELSIALKKLGKVKSIKGILIQKMIKGYEMLVGAKRDPVFGIVLVVGLGGIYTELIKDISYRLYPFSYEEFLYMISETKLSKLVRGFRGSGVIDVKKLYEIVIKVGLLMEHFPGIKEIDINPLIISDKEIMAVDGRIVIA